MAERVRTRENRVRDVVSGTRGAEISAADRGIMARDDDADDEPMSTTEADGPIDFVPPVWLKGLYPIPWSASDGCGKPTRHGQNCCLFYPLGYCPDMDVINGFCVFHLRALFNLVYQTDCLYVRNAQNKPVMSQSTGCYIAEPQAFDDQYTAVFPVVDLFPEEIELGDIKLHNLSKHLQMHGAQNWERIYGNHVNYLYRLLTLYSPKRTQRPVIETRADQLTNTQLMMHWNLWNEYYSKVLVDTRANINVFFMNDERDELLTLPISQCATITQMIARLFAEPYDTLNERRFNATVASYGIYARAHWSYADNLCTVGTHCTKGNLMCIGNQARLNMLRLDSGSCNRNTVHYTRLGDCGASYCVPSRLNLDSPSLNEGVVVLANDSTSSSR